MPAKAHEPESCVSANSTTRANCRDRFPGQTQKNQETAKEELSTLEPELKACSQGATFCRLFEGSVPSSAYQIRSRDIVTGTVPGIPSGASMAPKGVA